MKKYKLEDFQLSKISELDYEELAKDFLNGNQENFFDLIYMSKNPATLYLPLFLYIQ